MSRRARPEQRDRILRIRWRAVAAAVVLLWGPGKAAAAIDYQVTDIRISGNEKTRPEIFYVSLVLVLG